ncbi:MAG: TonB-dependent receptor [Pedobacter sp.]|uniref:TonB-dependent receptor n=1 Tax=Pedobacter sp. TaxID=1411316 RepID=UPI0028074113|nr:TonB-dependent receptor [Pedobacter sp.]MDQ8003577.1 TonB-dependent receptor [Pedobacter sp.]
MKKWYAFFFSCFLASYALAQNTDVSVYVSNAQNNPVQGAKVWLRTIEVYTDASGTAIFKDIPLGNYNLKVQAKTYADYEKRIQISKGEQHFHAKLKPEVTELKTVEINTNAQAIRKSSEARNIDIVDQEFVQRHLGGSLMKTLDRLPGISSIGIGSGQSKPLIRGMGFNRVVVVDKGIKHEGQQWGADHGLEIDQFAAGEIEVIKGPSSFVYGSDAIGGAINLKPVSVPLNQDLGGSVNLIGKTNNKHYGGSVNLFGSNKKWFFDSRVTYQNYADYRVPTDKVYVYDYAVNLHNNQLRNTAGRETGLHFSTGYVGKTFKTAFYASNSYAKTGFFANAHGLEPRNVDEALHDASDRDIQLPYQTVNHFKLINRTEFNHSNSKTELELGFQHNYRQEFNHYTAHGFMPPVYPTNMSIPINLERVYHKSIYSGNLRHSFSINKHQLQIGFNGDYQDNNISGWSFLIPAFQQFNAGLFAYDKYIINNDLILHGALRYDYGTYQFERYDDWFPSQREVNGIKTEEVLTRTRDFSRNFNSFVWSVGANYNPGKLNVKANIGKSFRMPIAKELAANGVNYHYFSFERGNENLDPEVAYQADFGITWTEKKWSVNFNPFYNYFPNYIYLNPTPYHDRFYGAGNQVFEYQQSSVVRYGAELKVNYQLLPSLSTEFLGEYLYSEQLSGDKKGFTIPFSPAPSALLNLTWSPKLGEKLSNTYFSVDYRLTARQENIVPPEKKTPGYQIVNLQLGGSLVFNKQNVDMSLQVQNLFDAKYLNHTSFYRLIELPEASRNVVLSLKIPFKVNDQ